MVAVVALYNILSKEIENRIQDGPHQKWYI